jgi:hypothetical protein
MGKEKKGGREKIPTFLSVAAEGCRGAAVKKDGALWAWGGKEVPDSFARDILGYFRRSAPPAQKGTDCDWAGLSVGGGGTLTIKADGTLWVWEGHSEKLFDLGQDVGGFYPVQIGTEADWANVSMGSNHIMAIKTDGTLWACGSNDSYQLDVRGGDCKTLTRIGEDKWAAVAAGEYRTVAIKADGTLWAWGRGVPGVGNGIRETITKIGENKKWKAVAVNCEYTMAIGEDGSLWAWGKNCSGQLGNGTAVNSDALIQIGTETNWAKVFAGRYHTAAIKTDGTLWTWGKNCDGQLGDGTLKDSLSPVQVGTDTDWDFASLGGKHTVAMKADGTLWAWGRNMESQLGIKSRLTKSRRVPALLKTSLTPYSRKRECVRFAAALGIAAPMAYVGAVKTPDMWVEYIILGLNLIAQFFF